MRNSVVDVGFCFRVSVFARAYAHGMGCNDRGMQELSSQTDCSGVYRCWDILIHVEDIKYVLHVLPRSDQIWHVDCTLP